MKSYLRAEISAGAVTSNISLLRGRLAPATKLCAVVKADCYGHGWQQLLGLIAGKADCLAVATPEEAEHPPHGPRRADPDVLLGLRIRRWR